MFYTFSYYTYIPHILTVSYCKYLYHILCYMYVLHVTAESSQHMLPTSQDSVDPFSQMYL